MDGSQYIGSVSTLLLMMVVDFCLSNNLNIPNECLSYLNSSTYQPNDFNERIPFKVWIDILSSIHEQYPIDGLGLEIAKHIKLGHAGVVSYLAFSEERLLQSVTDFMKYNRLVYDFNLMDIQIDGDCIEISWGDSRGRPGLLVDETAIGFFYNIVKQAIAPFNISLKCLNFIYSAPKNIKIYEGYFQCPIYFNSQMTSIVFSFSEIEKIHLNRFDPILYRLLKKQADRLVGQLEIYDNFEDRLNTIILYCIQKKDIKMSSVAKHMGISERKLSKKLVDSDLNFNDLVNEVRKNLAKSYLENHDLCINEIAYLLGYSEQSAFQRAFKKWTGKTPLKFRSEIK